LLLLILPPNMHYCTAFFFCNFIFTSERERKKCAKTGNEEQERTQHPKNKKDEREVFEETKRRRRERERMRCSMASEESCKSTPLRTLLTRALSRPGRKEWDRCFSPRALDLCVRERVPKCCPKEEKIQMFLLFSNSETVQRVVLLMKFFPHKLVEETAVLLIFFKTNENPRFCWTVFVAKCYPMINRE